jgi:O-antigen ligase
LLPVGLHQGKGKVERLRRKAALAIFALLVTAAPLLFGAVDAQVQIGLTLLLGAGLFIFPPAVQRIPLWVKRALLLLLALMVFKEFAPSGWFGETKWHKTLVENFSLVFPRTHNPEPGRAFDALLVVAIGAVWFLWVRMLALESENRAVLMWTLFIATAIFAVVCLAVHPGSRPHQIYGIRYTPGWTGYGPFPNRNHTACFLAMGAVLGCGCLVRAARRKRQLALAGSFAMLLVIFIALLESKSRGGLIACGLGLALYGLFAVIKLRNRWALAGLIGGALFFTVLVAGFGAKVSSRFHEHNEGDIPTNIRWNIWADTVAMWRDAPVFGHGLGTFPQIFPLYQTLNLENQLVLHPESSWLLWLAEIGALPLLLGAALLFVFIGKNVREMFVREHGFFLRAAGFSAFAVLLFHALWDVPAHRWAIAGYGLAILAIVCPLHLNDPKIPLKKPFALVPFVIAFFWLLPFFDRAPAWSSGSYAQIVARDDALTGTAEFENALRFFPLSPNLHQSLGMRLVTDYRDAETAWLHFRIADRLVPASWPLPAAQAATSRNVSAGMSLHFWTLAIERAGRRSEDLFYMAVENTRDLPEAVAFWSRYAENSPELLLCEAQHAPDSEARYYFQLWMKNRAASVDLKEFEIRDFYQLLARFGSVANLYEWMKNQPALEEEDYKKWAAFLHRWNDDATAWKLLSSHIREPDYPTGAPTVKTELLELRFATEPGNVLNAQSLAEAYNKAGQPGKAAKVILAVAAQEKPPRWFLKKAAYLQAAEGHYAVAVGNLLRED